ncbi:putative glyoxalase family protein [Rosellinia necatrix]|uniref:Putative glyoxalase family protein n=1 Tax=Rosellinia necatrix TaxID=77044 RepID=A0A1W2TX98_ROSNE|nr:putative glyoxalase family protein [Rosellinia necatrix]
MITGLHHINLVVPPGTLDEAAAFYGATLGLTPRAVPARQAGTLLWFDVGASGQQVHIAFGAAADFGAAAASSSRHPCFRVSDGDALLALRRRVHAHLERGGPGAPRAADPPGGPTSGAKGVEYPDRFFARDYAGNNLEFTV